MDNLTEILDIFMNELNLTESEVYMRDDKFYTKSGIVETQWVMFTNQNCFDLFGCPPPKNITKRIVIGIYSEYQIQKTDVIVQRFVWMCYILPNL